MKPSASSLFSHVRRAPWKFGAAAVDTDVVVQRNTLDEARIPQGPGRGKELRPPPRCSTSSSSSSAGASSVILIIKTTSSPPPQHDSPAAPVCRRWAEEARLATAPARTQWPASGGPPQVLGMRRRLTAKTRPTSQVRASWTQARPCHRHGPSFQPVQKGCLTG